MDKPTCETCPYWLCRIPPNKDDSDGVGYCRRSPPLVTSATLGRWRPCDESIYGIHHDRLTSAWPHCDGADWCGEHPDFPAWIESQRKPRRVSKDEIIVVDPIKVTNG